MAEVKTHGQSGYRRGCKCSTCRAGHAQAVARWRERKREREGAERAAEAAAPEPLPPLDSVPTIDLEAEAGMLELAFDEDLSNPSSKIAFQRTLTALAKYNARVLDQVPNHGRMDLVSPVQLRLLDVLTRLGLLGFTGVSDDGPAQSPESSAAAKVLEEIFGGKDDS